MRRTISRYAPLARQRDGRLHEEPAHALLVESDACRAEHEPKPVPN